MTKDELFQDLIFGIEAAFHEETSGIIPDEGKTAFTRSQCELFVQHFPTYVPGHYNPAEPVGLDLATRTRFWIKNLVVLVSQAIVHEDLREKVFATPALEPIANLLKQSASLRATDEE